MTASFSKSEGHVRFVSICALTALAISISVLAGWAADIPVLKSALSGYPEMRPISAIAFLALSVGLLLTVFDNALGWHKRVACALGYLTAGFAVVALGFYVLNFSSGSFSFVIPEMQPGSDSRGGRICAAIIFALLGSSLVLLHQRGRVQRQVSGLLAVTVLILTYALILGNLYHADEFYGLSGVNGTSIHLAFLSVVTGAGLLWRNRSCGIVRLMASGGLGGQAARRLIPFVVLGPTLIGWLHVMGRDRGLYDTGFGGATSTFILVMLMLGTVLFYSRAMHRMDQQRRSAEAELADKETRYRLLVEHGQGSISTHDLNGVLLSINPAGRRMLGYEEEEMVGHDLREFMPPSLHSLFDAYLRQITHEGIAQGIFSMTSKHGRVFTFRFNNVLVLEEGADSYVLGHAQDVTELFDAQRQLKDLSLRDDLTGLYNRRGFLTMAEHQIKLEKHDGTARGLTLLFADMDGLKAINDTYGHEAGSRAIKTLGRLISSVVRSADLVARWGGDEFVVLSVGAQDENAQLVVDRILERIDEHNAESPEPYLIGCSIGIASVDGEHSLDEIIAKADTEMYAEKKRRKAATLDDVSDQPHTYIRPWTGHAPRV